MAEPLPRNLRWRVWKFKADDPRGYETGADVGAEPFAVDNGIIYWKALQDTRLEPLPTEPDPLLRTDGGAGA